MAGHIRHTPADYQLTFRFAMRSHQIVKWFSVLLLGGFILAPLTSARAQAPESRSFSIQDGEVYIDGERLPPDDLPASLNTEGVQVQYTFSGDVRPVININGSLYVLEEDRIRKAEAADQDGVSVFMRQGPVRTDVSDEFGFSFKNASGDITDFAAPHAATIERKARELQAQAVHFQEVQARLQEQLGDRRIQELTDAAQRLGVRAHEAAMAAEALPQVEVQHYLDGIQRNDRELYDLLLQEREMEQETIRLSREIRALAEGPERKERTEELRARLDQIFELKQTNRRREIEQFEHRLAELQERLEEREKLRDDIIENRIRELLHHENDSNW